MSAGARRSESVAPEMMARTSTRIVMGRRSAIRTSHMSGPSRARLRQEGTEIAGGTREEQQRASHLEPRHRVVDLGLREQALRVGHVDHGRKASLEACCGLLFGGSCGGERGGR